MSSITQINKTIDPNLFTTLRINQLACRPSGSLTSQPNAEVIVNTSNYHTILNTELSAQEKECLALRFKHFSGLGNSFSTEQQEVHNYLKSISQGLYNPQLNGLQLLFCQMFVNKKDLSVQIGNYFTFSINGKLEKVTDMIDLVNCTLLLIMCRIQQSLKLNEKITEDLIASEIHTVQGFLKLFPPGLQKEGSSFTRLLTALETLTKCTKDKGKLFPILLQPIDQLHLDDTHTTHAELLTFSQNKLFLLSNSVHLLCEGIRQYRKTQDDYQAKIAKALKEKSLKNFPSLKTACLQFQNATNQIEALFKAAQSLADMVSNPRLLAAEEKICSEGPHPTLKLLEELSESQVTFYTLYSGFIDSFKKEESRFLEVLNNATKNKILIDGISDILATIEVKFDFFIKTPLSIFRKALPATTDVALIDLQKTCSFLQSMKREFPLVSTLSCHLRWIDVFTISVLNPLLRDALNKPDETLSDLITSLFAFSNDINGLRKHINMSGGKAHLKTAQKITDNQQDMLKVNAALSDPKIYHLDLLNKATIRPEDYSCPLDFSNSLFLYPTLSLPLGIIETIDHLLLDFFNQTIETASAYAANSINVIKLFTKKSDALSKEMSIYSVQWIDFYQKVIDLLSKPLASQEEVSTLSRSLRKHFKHYPSVPEELIDVLESNPNTEDTVESHIVNNAFGDFKFLKMSILSSLLRFESRAHKSPKFKEQKASPMILQIETPEPVIQGIEVSKTPMETQPKPVESLLKTMNFMQFSQKLQSGLKSLEAFKLYLITGKEQEVILRNDRIEKSLGNLQHQLLTLQSLSSLPGISYLQIEALQRANALLLESALNYVFAFSEVKDSMGKHVVVSDEVSRWQHQLMEMVHLVRNSGQDIPLSNHEEMFLQSVSSMLSKAVNPSHFPGDPRLTSLKKLHSSLGIKNAEAKLKNAAFAAYEESVMAMQICNRLLFPNLNKNNSSDTFSFIHCELPKNFSAANHTQSQNTLFENVLTAYNQLEELMQEDNHTVRLHDEPLLHFMFRDQLVNKNFKDIAFHMEVSKEGLAALETQRATFPEVNTLFLHLSLMVEKSLKIMTLILPVSSENNNQTGQHVLFEVVNNRPRRYDHHLERNLFLLQSALPESLKLNLSNDSSRAIEEFAEYIGELSRYPSGRTGTIAKIMDELKTLNLLIENIKNAFLSPEEEDIVIQRCGKESSTWAKNLNSQLQSLQSNELLPRTRALLSATDALLQHAARLINC